MSPADFTIGVEEEYQLVDVETGALRSSATALRHGDWSGEILPELQETTIEIGTPICGSVTEVSEQLHRLRFQAGTVAAAHGLAIVAAGLHPFSDWHGHERPAIERYRLMEARYGRIAVDEHIFGMHIHVGVPDGIDRLMLMNVLRQYLPHLLALSASSPFFEGSETGFASYRTILWRRWPNSGIPPRFSSQADYEHYVQRLLHAGVIGDPYNLYWSARPHPRYPTIEFRVTDVCPSAQDAVAIAALSRALVHAAVTGALPDDALDHMDSTLEHETIRVNEWAIARDGLDARLIDVRAPEGDAPARTAVRRLVDTVRPSAQVLGDADALKHIGVMLERGVAADRMRRVFRETDSLRALVHWLMDESLIGTGLDKRAAQRERV